MNLSNNKHVVILGAGITGLSLAWKLQKNCRVTVLEKTDRAGGWIQTLHKEGFLFEQGPRSFRGMASLKLVEDLGLQEQIIYTDPSARIRYLLDHQTLQPLPQSLRSLFSSPLLKGVKRTLLKELFCFPAMNEETIYEFFCRRFNSLVAERFIDPLVSGIFAGDIHRLSLQACFPSLHEMENRYGSIIKGFLKAKKTPKIPTFSLKGGMESLVHTLVERLTVPVNYSTEVQQIIPTYDKVILKIKDQPDIVADQLFSAIPGRNLIPLMPSLAEDIQQIPYASIIVINFGYRQNVLDRKGFGYLVPSKEHEDILGVVWDSSVFPGHNSHPEETRLTVMMGGMSRPYLCELPMQKLIDVALNSLERHLGISQSPDAVAFKLCKQAIPQYILGYPERNKAIKAKLAALSPRIHLLGPLLDGVGINDCLSKVSSI